MSERISESYVAKSGSNSEKEKMILTYDTLLFNYYEFLAICLYKRLVNESNCQTIKIFFE